MQQIEETRIRKQEEQKRRRELAKAARTGATEDDNADAMEGDDLEDEAGEDGDMDLEDGDDDEPVDESNPMAALVASARRAARKYKNKRREDPEYEEGDSMDDGDDFDEDDEDDMDDDDGTGNGHVIEVPGGATSRKAYDKVFKSVVEQADVVLYVLDARDPEGTRSRDVERAVLAAAGGDAGKRLILILNKVDLVPPPVLHAWLTHLRGSFPTLPLRASGAAPNAQTFNHRDITVQSTSSALFRALKSYAANRNLKRSISVGVIGYPNVGKSSVINALLSRLGGNRGSQRMACPAGAEAGVTTAIRTVKIDNHLMLLDSPGIVFPSSSTTSDSAFGSAFNTSGGPKNAADVQANLILLNAVPPKLIEDPIPAVTLLIKRLSAASSLPSSASPDARLKKLADVYDLPPLMTSRETGDVTTDFLIQVARKRGRLGKGGVPNLHAAAMTVITDWRDGRIQGWVDPPKHSAAAAAAAAAAGAVPAQDAEMADGAAPAPAKAASAASSSQKTIVTEWAKEFKLEGLWGDDETAEPAANDVDAMQA